MNIWADYLEMYKPINVDYATAVLVSRCIVYSSIKQQALEFAVNKNFPKKVLEVLIHMPQSLLLDLSEVENSFETLAIKFNGNLTQMLDYYTINGLSTIENIANKVIE